MSVFDNFYVFLSVSRRLPMHRGLPFTSLDAHRKVSIYAANFRFIYGAKGELRIKTFENMLDMTISDMWVVWDIVYLSILLAVGIAAGFFFLEKVRFWICWTCHIWENVFCSYCLCICLSVFVYLSIYIYINIYIYYVYIYIYI